MLNVFFGTATLSSALRLSTPLILSSVGGCYCDRAGTFNIALESFMLTSAFFAAYGAYLTANPYVGILMGILAGILCGAIFGLFVFNFGSSGIVVSIAMNLGSWGLTTLMMLSVFKTRGSFMHERLVSLPTINVPILNRIPYIKDIFNNQNILVYFALLSVVLLWVIMYKTAFGLRLRGVGINARAAQTTGTDIKKYRWYSVLITGAFCGVAGAVLPLGGTSIFSENMTAGRGFLAVAAILVGRGNPLLAALSCLLFAYTDALSLGLQNVGIPSQIVLTLPYIATIIVLALISIKGILHRKKHAPGLHNN